MIVNPQFFNYRLIIGSLVATIAVLCVFSFTSYQSIRTHQQFLEQEKHLMENELSQMILRYDNSLTSNNLLSSQIEDAKRETQVALDSLKLMQVDLSVISKFKNQVINLKEKNNLLFFTIDSLKAINHNLQKEKLLAYNELQKERLTNKKLSEENFILNKKLEEGAVLTANSFKAKAVKNFLGKAIITRKASSTNQIDVSFTLVENALAENGDKELYVQIVNPKNNVVADKGSIDFGNSLLIYSLKEVVNYQNNDMDVTLSIDTDNDDQPLTKGTYHINVFHKNHHLGSTKIELN
ncbi:hypothetical protein EVU94_03295 [Flavobacteriaceae bacterium 144Ye]|nr:hypothetical protein EVU94_03295 [Flavobacteriaceae bacterium 144Ye]